VKRAEEDKGGEGWKGGIEITRNPPITSILWGGKRPRDRINRKMAQEEERGGGEKRPSGPSALPERGDQAFYGVVDHKGMNENRLPRGKEKQERN